MNGDPPSCRPAPRGQPGWARQRRITEIVDSVLLSARPAVHRVLPCWHVSLRGRPALMVGVAERELRARGRRVSALVVVGIGYNSLWEHGRRRYGYWAARFDREANRLLDTLRDLGARQIVWVTLREPRARDLTPLGRSELGLYSWYFPYVNERLRRLDRRYDDLVLADWATVSHRRGLTYDSIHVTSPGALLINRTIKQTIADAARLQSSAG